MNFINEIQSFSFIEKIHEAVASDPDKEVQGSLSTVPNIMSSISDRVSPEETKKIDNVLDLMVLDRAIDTLMNDPRQREHFLVFQKPETIISLKKYQDRLKDRISKLNRTIDSELAKSATSKENPIEFTKIEKAVDKIQLQNQRLKTVRAIYEFYEKEKEKTILDGKLLQMKVNQTPFKYKTKEEAERPAVVTKVGPYDSEIHENSVQIKFIDSNKKWSISKDDFWEGKTDLDREEMAREAEKLSAQNQEVLNQNNEVESDSVEAVKGIKPVAQKKLSEGFDKVNTEPTEENVSDYLVTLKEMEDSAVEPLLKDDIQEARKAAIRKAKSANIDPRTYSEKNIARLTHNRIVKDLNNEIKEYEKTNHKNKEEVQRGYERIAKEIANATFRKTTLENEDDRDELTRRLDKVRDQKLKEVEGRSYVDDVNFDNLGGFQLLPNADLPLNKEVPLMVKNENRIQDSPLTKFRKIFWSAAAGVLGGGQPLTDLSKEISADMVARRKAVMQFTNTIATSLASVGGEKAKKKADTLTKNLSYSAYNNKFDVEKKTNESKLEEEMLMASPEGTGGNPGSNFQAPGTTPTMGDPVAPTQDSPGSGDNFNPKKKKKKKDAPRKVFDFATFVEENYGKNGKKTKK